MKHISEPLVRAYESLKAAGQRWITTADVCSAGVNPNTAKTLLTKLRAAGVVECRDDLHPGHRYRLAERPSKEAKALIARIEGAAEAYREGR